MTDERWQTGPVMLALGTIWTFAANNPTEFVAMLMSVLGGVIMLVKYADERKRKNEEHRLKIELLRKKLDE